MTSNTPHLWEIDHPYYCQEGNFYKNGLDTEYASWDEFTGTGFFSGGRDLNLLFRWDWTSWRRHPDPELRCDEPEELRLFFVLQRKAILCSVGIRITDDDEPRVRRFLDDCSRTVAALWAPLDLGRAQ